MKSLTKTIALIVLLIAVSTLIFMSVATLKISLEAKTLNQAVNISKNIAEIFAEADTEKEFIGIVEKDWTVINDDESIKLVKEDFEITIKTETEPKEKGTLIKLNILVFNHGERIYDLDTLKYIHGEVSYYE